MRIDQMSKAIRALFLTTAVLILGSSAGAQEVIKRKPGESLQVFAKRIIPPKTDLVHTVIEGKFGGFANAVVLFFDNTDKLSAGFTGWVLALNADGSYKKYILPAIEAIPGQFEFSINSVFFANADKDPQLELIVLYEQYRNGTGEDPFHAAFVYHWDGNAFVSLRNVEPKLNKLTTAKAVRMKLKALGY
jgi:hypothetical protein